MIFKYKPSKLVLSTYNNINITKYFKIRTVSPKKASADLAMSTVKEEKIALEEIERNLTEKQNILEKQKLEYEETITKKENHINKVSMTKYINILF